MVISLDLQQNGGGISYLGVFYIFLLFSYFRIHAKCGLTYNHRKWAYDILYKSHLSRNPSNI